MTRISAALCLTLAFPALHAQPGGQGPDRQPPRRIVLEALDLNHDGELSPDEIQAAPQSLLTLDRNHDGELTADEYLPEQHNRAADTDFQQRLMALDRNGDGVLTADEIPERMQPLFQRADTNHDGKLTQDEVLALAAAQSGPKGRPVGRNGAEGMARLDPVLNALDFDHDGTLSPAEIASAPGALKTLDTNADGTLQANEIRVRQQTPAERAAHVLDEWDTDKDGVLSKAECPDRLQQQFDAVDTNHDGKLNREELTTYFATTQTQPGRGSTPRNDAPSAPTLPTAGGQNIQPAQPR